MYYIDVVVSDHYEFGLLSDSSQKIRGKYCSNPKFTKLRIKGGRQYCHDVGIIRLDENIIFSKNVQPICMSGSLQNTNFDACKLMRRPQNRELEPSDLALKNITCNDCVPERCSGRFCIDERGLKTRLTPNQFQRGVLVCPVQVRGESIWAAFGLLSFHCRNSLVFTDLHAELAVAKDIVRSCR